MNNYFSLYRKYRPQTFEEIVGQEVVVKILKNSLDADPPKISHAYLLAGPKGSGKTSLARILAKALNCKKGITSNPCLECESCIAIREGNDFDVIEIDAASNRGIDEIRELREATRFVPVKRRFKIFIIDEAHMLTTQAFNALLKTLEEPPPYVVFILATTEPGKLPETILSRCLRFDFKRLSSFNVLNTLKHIKEKEGIKIEESALKEIVLLSFGSLRNAIAILDQFSSQKEEVKPDEILDLLNVPSISKIYEFLDNLIEKKIEAFYILRSFKERGIEAKVFIENLIKAIDTIIFLSSNPLAFDELETIEKDKILLIKKKATVQFLVNALEIYLESLNYISYLEDPYPVLEVLTFNIFKPQETETIEESKFEIKKKKEEFEISSQEEEKIPPQLIEVKKQKKEQKEEEAQDLFVLKPLSEEEETIKEPVEIKEDEIKNKFQKFLDELSNKHYYLYTIFKTIKILDLKVRDGFLVVFIDKSYSYTKNVLEKNKEKVLIPALTSSFGLSNIEFELKEADKNTLKEVFTKEKALEIKKVKKLVDLFDATIESVEEE